MLTVSGFLLADWHSLGLASPTEITHLESNTADELSPRWMHCVFSPDWETA